MIIQGHGPIKNEPGVLPVAGEGTPGEGESFEDPERLLHAFARVPNETQAGGEVVEVSDGAGRDDDARQPVASVSGEL